MTNRSVLAVICTIFLLIGCDKNPTPSSDIGVNWDSRVYYTANYSGGVYTGQTCEIDFTITDGSGDLKITAEMIKGNGNKKSINYNVTENGSYTLKFLFTKSGDVNCSNNTIVAKMEIRAGYTSPKIIDYYCNSSSRPNRYEIGNLNVE